MDAELRPMGIEGMGNIPWGKHIGHFYLTKEDLLDTMVPYFKAGLENNEFCLWVISKPLTKEEAMNALRQAVPDLDRYLADRSIEILLDSEWYTKGSTLDIKRVTTGWDAELDQALARDYVGMRAAGDLGWLEEKDWEDISKYEAKLDELVPMKRMTLLCSYPLSRRFAANAPIHHVPGFILDVVRTHRMVTTSRNAAWQIVQSPELRASEERVRLRSSMLDQVRNAVIATDLDGRIIYWNKFAEILHQWTAREALGENILNVLAPKELEQAGADIIASTAEVGHWEGEFTVKRKDGSMFPVHAVLTLFRDEQGQPAGIVGISIDITERRRAEEGLRLQAARAQLLADVSLSFAEAGLDYQAVLNTLVRLVSELIGDQCSITLLSDDGRHLVPVAFHHRDPQVLALLRDAMLAAPLRTDTPINRVVLSGQPVHIEVADPREMRASISPQFWPYLERFETYSLLIVLMRVQGRIIGTVGISRGQPGRPYTHDDQVLLQDLADRAALTIENARLFQSVSEQRERLRVLSARLVETAESERRRLALELHDELSQLLTALIMQVGTARKVLLTSNGKARVILEETETLAERTLNEVRRIMADLRPALLDDLGLVPALRQLADDLHMSGGAAVSVEVANLPDRLPPQTEIALFRIAQEALTNMRKHAHARHVTLTLSIDRDRVRLVIVDDGDGMSLEDQSHQPRQGGDVLISGGWVERAGHFGLLGMQERAELLGGTFQLESAPQAGTTVRVELPL